MRFAVTGASGRLGRALVLELGARAETRSWSRPEYDLDDPSAAARLLRSRPDVVVHSAAWTEVDACARDLLRAMRRNARAVDELAAACAWAGARLVLISTNEVFGGEFDRPLTPSDAVGPVNPYGESKLAGERGAQRAFAATPQGLLIVRTAWLYGPPGNDFPAKIVAAARRARESGAVLRLVSDEVGSPSFTRDVARGVAELVFGGAAGVRHVVNAGQASRAEWARVVLDEARIDVATKLVPASTWRRNSTPPRWGVLRSDVELRSWQAATREYVSAERSAALP